MPSNSTMKRALAAVAVLVLALVVIGGKRRSVRTPTRPLAGTDEVRSVLVDGIRHDFHIYLPSAYDGVNALPVVLFFHGGGGNAEQGEATVNLRPTAEKHAFILVRPEGYDRTRLGIRTWNAGNCCGAAMEDAVDHVGAVREILVTLAAEWKIDPARVFATGHSNGGMMSYRLACELGDRIAAIAPNAAALVDRNLETSPPEEIFPCTPPRAVAVMHMHGDADTCSPLDGGVSTGLEQSLRPSVSDAMTTFIAINGASSAPRASFNNGDVTCSTHDGTKDVVLCIAEGGGHAWPGAAYSRRSSRNCGGGPITGMDANEAMWAFFNGSDPQSARRRSSSRRR
jgi:polyhydroxybutyrate depolymerase